MTPSNNSIRYAFFLSLALAVSLAPRVAKAQEVQHEGTEAPAQEPTEANADSVDGGENVEGQEASVEDEQAHSDGASENSDSPTLVHSVEQPRPALAHRFPVEGLRQTREPVPLDEITGEWSVESGVNLVRAAVVGDGTQVITVARVMQHGGRLTIHGGSGEEPRDFDAEVVARDRETGLVLLGASGQIGPPPEVAPAPLAGDVVRVRQAGELRTAVVRATWRDILEVNGICEEGAPVWDAEAKLVGVCVSEDRFVAVEPVLARMDEADPEEKQNRQTRINASFGFEASLRLSENFDPRFMARLRFGVLAFDRVALVARLGTGSRGRSDNARNSFRTLFEATIEAQLHHAFRLGPAPIRLVAGIGLTGRFERHYTHRTYLASADPGCDLSAGECEVTTRSETSSDDDWRYFPELRAEIHVGRMMYAYDAQIDVDNLSATVHTISLGASW